MVTMMKKTYSELIRLRTFEERYRYLRIGGKVGEETFGFDRWLNQLFYKDNEWRSVRNSIIVRDGACDLAMPDRDIGDRIYVHHINPISKSDILRRSDCLFDPENLICTSKNTHDAIHYGDERLLIVAPIVRRANDTCPWKK
jgi:hypothetical protein